MPLSASRYVRLYALYQGQCLGGVGYRTPGNHQPHGHSVGVYSARVQFAVQPPFVRAMDWFPLGPRETVGMALI